MQKMQLKPLNSQSVFNRTLNNLTWGWKRISASGDEKIESLRADLPDADIKILRNQLKDCLEIKGGEVKSRARAAGLGQAYLELNDQGRIRFLKLVIDEFGIDHSRLRSTIDNYIQEPENSEYTLDILRSQLRPPWTKLFTQFNALPSGVKFLVDMRADLIRFSAQEKQLQTLSRDLQNLLISWFDIGFLDLKRITWNEPASLLEKLIAYEAVHEIQSWDDLKNRLDIDRCCYAFFHPRMPDEPLIFVQVALVNELSGNIHDLLDNSAPVEDPESADTAIFYSISNTQLGLKGVSLGDFLIKRVVASLTKEFPNLKTFATLSPIPRFKKFIHHYISSENHPITNDEELLILKELIQDDPPLDFEQLEGNSAARNLLMRMSAHYLVEEKRGDGAADSVANFHLTNGAKIEHINWMGDHSNKGLDRSFGLMVNYFYKLSEIEKNHESYVGQGDINFSSQVKSLLKRNNG